MKLPYIYAVFFMFLVLTSCKDERMPLSIDEHVLRISIADTIEERARGLMFRTDLADDEGMLFIFQETKHQSFWMKNTPLPLSIAYIDELGRILEIYDMEPYSLEPVPSQFPIRYALEVKQGTFERLDIIVGSLVHVSALRGY